METIPQRTKNMSNEILRESILHNQISQVIAETNKIIGEHGSKITWNLSREVITKIWGNTQDDAITMEQVESLIEHVLRTSPYKHTAKMLIFTRDRRNRVMKSGMTAEMDRVNQDISRLNWKVRENSNIYYSLQSLNHYLSGVLSQTYWLNNVYPLHIIDAHESEDLYIHDLNRLSGYCGVWDLASFPKEGFCSVSEKTEAYPPQHFRIILGQVVKIFICCEEKHLEHKHFQILIHC
jgi:ribonucleoside-triphosphate reductase